MEREYHFQTNQREDLKVVALDILSAYYGLKRKDPENFQKLKRYNGNSLPPQGYSLLSVGFGLNVACQVNYPEAQLEAPNA